MVHCVVLAYPAQGHINPMHHFSKLLQQQGVKVTLVTTFSYCKSLQNIPSSIALKSISDGFDNSGLAEAGNWKVYLERFWQVGPKTLAELLEKHDRSVLDEEQIREIAYVLRDSDQSYFLWVVKASEETKLPKDFEKKSEKGLVVGWCSQLKVLAHEAVGCFVTHWGWNSTLEALSLGVPMVAMPYWFDQSINAKLIVDVWKMGIRATVDEQKIVRGEVLKYCIMEKMNSEKGKEVKGNMVQWKALAARFVSKEGSSHKNIAEFVNSLFNLQAACRELQNNSC
ncbi:mogroside IE synthase isoform X3 [Glycine max]|uniref:UDP-glycosyltransferases domain-containing protein n=1 Tax=Glycine max TaxID=3847 RepID=A0A0R0ICY5_SOYBN|nr:mogroside IE synthase isoform X3 [Glycine max]|eukprot:XP_006587791.1 UDP-glycosyltransferase 74B1 isoform X3 [Glycine max]